MSDIQPAVTAEYARLRAECERLQEQLDAWKDKAFDALATLKQANDNTEAAEAECERLRAAWRLVERYCDTYPTDWRLVFKRGGEVLEVSVPEEVWRAFDAALVEADDE